MTTGYVRKNFFFKKKYFSRGEAKEEITYYIFPFCAGAYPQVAAFIKSDRPER